MRPSATAIFFALIVGASCSGSSPERSRVAEIALASAVDLRITGCRVETGRGAGSMIRGASGRAYILTAAHVVAGSDSITVRPVRGGEEGEAVKAVLLAIDPVNDMALLGADLELPALPLTDVATGDDGVAVLFRQQVATPQPFSVVNPVVVNMLDIYGENEVSRMGYRVAIEIDPGDSGALLVGPDGGAAGVLYAKVRGGDGHAFATNTSAVPALIDAAAEADPLTGIDTGACP